VPSGINFENNKIIKTNVKETIRKIIKKGSLTTEGFVTAASEG
jgi:hypothetical protein